MRIHKNTRCNPAGKVAEQRAGFQWGSSPLIRVIALLFILGSAVFSQSNLRLTGVVNDVETRLPLSGVNVWIENSTHGAVSDLNGRFYIENIPPGDYTVLASFIGYDTAIIRNVSISIHAPAQLLLDLSPRPIDGTPVIVVSAKSSGVTDEGDRITITSEFIDRYRSVGMAQLLQQFSAIQVASSGGGNSESRISIHGSRFSQVLVLLDGQRLNNPQTGTVDLSEIPLDQIEKIEIVRQGNVAAYGNQAFAGVVAFHTAAAPQQRKARLKAGSGAFATASGNGTVNIPLGDFSLQVNYQQEYSRQDFTYRYEDSDYNRRNAWYRRRKLFGKINFNKADHQSHLRLQLQHGKQGLPSTFFEEMDHFNAFKDGDSQLLQAAHRWFISSRLFLKGQFNYQQLTALYDNEAASSPFLRYKIDQVNRIYEGKITGNWQPADAWKLDWRIAYLEEQLNHQNLLFERFSIGEKIRHTVSGGIGLEMNLPGVKSLFRVAKLKTALGYESYFGQAGKGYPAASLNLSPKHLSWLNFSAGWAKAIRYPDFNSLFWKGDARARGNPDLLPEQKRSWHSSIRFDSGLRFLPVFSAYYYNDDIQDLIFWHRTVNGTWEPRNEAKVEKQGWDLQLHQKLPGNILELQGNYSFIDAVNRSEEPNYAGKEIVFIPRHTYNISLTGNYRTVRSMLIYRSVSQRQTVAANTADPLSPYEIWDAVITWQQEIGNFAFSTSAALKNFTDVQYQILRGYPMPGSDYQLSISTTYHF